MELGKKLAEVIYNEGLGSEADGLMKQVGQMVNSAQSAAGRKERIKSNEGFISAQSAVEKTLSDIISKK